MENKQYHHYSWARVSILLLFILFISLGGFLFILNKSQESLISSEVQMTEEKPKQTRPIVQKDGNIRLVTTKVTSVHAGETLPIVVKADSNNKTVAGFDILITYDPAVFTLTQVTPLDRRFQISSYTQRKGFISITGTKSNNSEMANLSNSDLVSFGLSALKKGNSEVNLKTQVNAEKTKFIDTNFKQMIPELQSMKLDIL